MRCPARVALGDHVHSVTAALALSGTHPGRYSLDRLTGVRVPKALTRLTVFGAAAMTAYSAAQVVRTKRAASRAQDAPPAAEVAAASAPRQASAS